MKLGNRKVVIGGLTAVAFTSLTAFTNVTPDTTSDTNLISATPSVLYQNNKLADFAGNLDFSSLFLAGRATSTLEEILENTSYASSKNPVKAQAGIAKLFTQNETLESVDAVPTSDNEEVASLSKAALNNDNVGEEATDTTAESAQDSTQNNTAATDTTTPTQTTTSEEVVSQPTAADSTTQVTSPQEVAVPVDTTVGQSQDTTTQQDTQAQAAPVMNEADAKAAEAKAAEAKAAEVKAAEAKAAEEAKWANKVMANVEESVNIRSEANEEADVVGKLYKGAEADILEKGDVWTKISSGSVTEGYVKNEFLAYGDEAEALAAQDGKLIATVATDALRVRSEASEDADVLDLAESGAEYTVVAQDGDWVEIQFTSDKSGFVSSEFVTVDYVLGKAITIEEEEAMIAEQKRKEAEAKQAEIAASEDAALLAAVVKMEAGGESYEGKLAVASVVVNRMRSGAYPSSVSGVVYQSGQFPGAGNGTLAGILANGVGGDCKKAAVEALSGLTNVDYYHFNSVSRIGTSGYVIGNHCFY